MEKPMKSRRSESLGLLALAVTASPCALAADPHWYLGGNVGQSRSHFDEAAIARTLQGPALTTTSIASDDKDLGYKLFVGYQFHRNFAVEGGYFDLGDFRFNTTTAPPGTLNASYEVKGWNLDLVGILPLAERFSAFGRVGAAYGRTTTFFSGTGAVLPLGAVNPSDSDTNVKYGFGLQYDINYYISLRAEAERYRVSNAVNGKDNVDLYSLGVVFRFAKAPAPPPRAVTPEPTPAPVVAPPPPPKKAPPPPPEAVAPPPPPPPVQQPAPRRDRN
jgi:OOP family OmpA-OmpF porin